MHILIKDMAQYASNTDVLGNLLTPALFETYERNSFSIEFEEATLIDCIGVAHTDATYVEINGTRVVLEQAPQSITRKPLRASFANGLYILPETSAAEFNVVHDGSHMGRFALGKSRTLGIDRNREQGYYSTAETKITASGSVVTGLGGVVGRKVSLDTRYQIDPKVFFDFDDAIEFISRGYPFFLSFNAKELTHNLHWPRLYAGFSDGFKSLVLQTGIKAALYSYRFNFEERF